MELNLVGNEIGDWGHIVHTSRKKQGGRKSKFIWSYAFFILLTKQNWRKWIKQQFFLQSPL